MLHTLKPFNCPSCGVAYSNRDLTGYHSLKKFPLILPCKHSVCEVCLESAIKNHINYACVVCKNSLDLSKGKDSIVKLNPDIHALGILNVNKKAMHSVKMMQYSPDVMQNIDSNNQPKSASIHCEHCNHVEALWQCDECQQNFCSICYDKVHRNLNSKKKHEVRKIFAELYNTLVQEGCKEHKNKIIEYYCETDNSLTCSHCMLVGKHVGHEVKSLVDKNKTCIDDLKNVVENISEIEERLKYTEHLLMKTDSLDKIDISQYIDKVHNYFHKLHSVLQARETLLISQLQDAANIQNHSFEKMVFEISRYQKDIISLKRDAEDVIKNPCLAISAPLLLEKLESLKTLPCYLLPIKENADMNVEIDLKMGDEIENFLEQYGAVEYSFKPKFSLVPKDQLPENYCFHTIPDNICVSDADSQSTATVDNFSEDSLISANSKCDIQAAYKYREFCRAQPEKVMVAHIIDPSCFWIQRWIDIKKLASLSHEINKWCKSYKNRHNRALKIERGDLYLVQFSEDKKWYRGRVKRILENSDICNMSSVHMNSAVVLSEKKTVKKEDFNVEIFYIDYGNSEVVPTSRMLNIQPHFFGHPGFAKQCSLVDIAPIENDSWNAKSIKSFTKFVSCKPLIMQVYEIRGNVSYVDLSQTPNCSVTNDVPVSVRDALVFQELAIFPAGKNISSKVKRNEPQFLPAERLGANSNISVIVSHVVSPSHFYVQQISTAHHLSTYIVEMKEYFTQETNTLLTSIFAPRVGMICAAMFSVDKQWYRAIVKSLPGGANVEVQYVDFGNTEIINHKYLRKLPDKFIKLNIQAIPCKLADVTYNQEKCWSTESKDWFTDKVSRKHLALNCLGYILDESKHDAVLFYEDDELEICINALMVQEGFASSCGPKSKVAIRKIDAPSSSKVYQIPLHIAHSSDSLENDHIPDLPTETKPKFSTLTKVFPDTEGIHTEVHISQVQNPSSFYVRIAGDIEKKLNNLMSNMQEVYKSTEMPVDDICKEKLYAVFSETHRKWYRGKVLENKGECLKIEFVDYGILDEVPSKNIQKLMDHFTYVEKFAIHCELCDIIPAGGSDRWSFAACDAFKDLISNYEILHLTSKVDIEHIKKSVPVNMFIEEIIVGGALEPTKISYKNIAHELISLGVALPIRSSKYMSKSENSDSDSIKSMNSENCQIAEKYSGDSVDDIKNVTTEHASEQMPPQKEIELEKSNMQLPKSSTSMFQWKPVVYPKESEFKGFITNIGEDGSIHLHMYKEDLDIVEIIKESLQSKCNQLPFEKLLHPPSIGEGCVAKFAMDALWYRAEVLTVYDENKLKVNFVDYGNNEIVTLNDIRTDITIPKFPKQCLECTIYGLHAGECGHWDEDLLNFLHSQLVEKIVNVEVVDSPDDNGKLPCCITTSCGISILELLMNMGFMEEKSFQQIEYQTFQKSTELKEGHFFPVCISQISAPNIVYLQCLKIPFPKSDYEKEHNKEHEGFLELTLELQKMAETFTMVKDPRPGLPCCAKYSYDGSWYRCEVTEITENGVVVLYVDYGNSEMLPSENLRNLNNKFISFPVQVHFCKINGMSPVGDDWNPKVQEFMIEKLISSQQDIFAKVMTPGEISEIDLFVEDGSQLKLAYEELVERNLITLQGKP